MSMQLLFILIVMLVCIGANAGSFSKQDKSYAKLSKKAKPSRSQPKIGEMARKPQREHALCKAATVKSHKIGTLGLEDRENDWLAKQLREETKLKKKIFSE